MKKQAPQQENLPGVKIQTVSRIFALIGLVLILCVGWNLRTVVIRYRDLVDEFNLHMDCHSSIDQLQNGTDNMTEQSRLFVITQDPACMLRYTEIVDSGTREAAREALVRQLQGKEYDQSIKILNRALKKSNELMDPELHAMKLVTLASGTRQNLIPNCVADYTLPEGEESWSKEQQLSAARDLVFGKEYREKKNLINVDIQTSVNSMSDQLEGETANGLNLMEPLIHRLIVLCLLLGGLLILVFYLVRFLIILPLRESSEAIRNNREIAPKGSAEFRYLATTYNRMFESNRDSHLRMNYMLEHDSLTDVSSRLAFDEQKKLLADSPVPMALLIFDIDHFKEINDTYGHEVGDRALIRVATTVRTLLRHDDLVFRIGGDEFAVILMNVYPYSRTMVEEKLLCMNEKLLHPNDGSPKLSLSAGIAFSEHGFSEELFRRADRAMYEAKTAGRCCFRFSEGEIAENSDEAACH